MCHRDSFKRYFLCMLNVYVDTKILNIHGAGELSKFLFSSQAPSANSNPYFLSSSNTCDQTFDSLFTNINPCIYYGDLDSIPKETPSATELSFVHVDIRSLNENFDDLSHFLLQFSVSTSHVL